MPGWSDGMMLRSAGQRGAALAYVLALLALISFLVGMTWRMIRADNAITARDRGDSQARLIAFAGIDYALSRIGPPGPHQDLGYATDGLEYRLDDSGRVFRLNVRTRGLFARAVSVGVSPVPPPGLEREKAGLIGQTLELSRLPVLGLLNHEGNMVLAGSAQVTGPVMLWRGDVRKATDYHLRYTGGGHAGPLWDSTSQAWKRSEVVLARAYAWIDAQGRMLEGKDFTGDGDYDSGTVIDLRLPDSALLADTLIEGARITAGVLRIGAGARLKDCKIAARRILIQEGSRLERVIAFSQGNLEVTGGDIQAGQFLAVDSVRIACERPFAGYPFFFAQGRMARRGRPDSAMVGALLVEKASGDGVFFSACRDHALYDQEVRLSLGKGARLTGLAYTPCYARAEGELQGSLICHNLKFEYSGTIWLGHLKDARLATAPGARIPVPLLFSGFAPAALESQGI